MPKKYPGGPMDQMTLTKFRARFMVNQKTGCWEWSRLLDGKGYGLFNIGARSQYFAHRVSYEHFVGSAGDLCVLHRCDNRRCVNPEHLFLGTRTDNHEDMMQKGRHRVNAPRGEEHTRSKLTWEKVREIRRDYDPGLVSVRDLARKHGISTRALRAVLSGTAWREDGAKDLRSGQIRGERSKRSKLTTEQVLAVREEFARGDVSLSELGRRYGISHNTIRAVVLGHTWRHITARQIQEQLAAEPPEVKA